MGTNELKSYDILKYSLLFNGYYTICARLYIGNSCLSQRMVYY